MFPKLSSSSNAGASHAQVSANPHVNTANMSATAHLGAAGAVILSGVIQYVGAAVAVRLFAVAAVLAVGWGRVAVGALVMLIWQRPRLARRAWGWAACYGLTLVTMNMLFYIAISRIPLGSAVAVEYIGPILLAVCSARTRRIYLAVACAACGVGAISWAGVRLEQTGVLLGIGAAFAAGIAWAGYLWIGGKIAKMVGGYSALAVGMGIGCLCYAPLAVSQTGVIFAHPRFLGMMIIVGICSSVVPYVIDARILRNIPAGQYALFNAILPATSAVVAVFLLRQLPGVGDIVGIALVTCAVLLVSSESIRSRHARPDM
ncbi:EamA family transporter [Trueperella sp. LYQ143]|uniref:EamA family transporter n=1 Tax=unclassified Trueperella TaxID=2630174 RepID=UPI003983820F